MCASICLRFRWVSGRYRAAEYQIRDRMATAKTQQELLGRAGEVSGRGAERGSSSRRRGSYR